MLSCIGVRIYLSPRDWEDYIVSFGYAGLNCAEAVNFAPADWLPHGGFGAELYQLYHKPAVLSHEELLCVVAKVWFFLLFLYLLSTLNGFIVYHLPKKELSKYQSF